MVDLRVLSVTDAVVWRRLDGDAVAQKALRCRVGVWALRPYDSNPEGRIMATQRRRLRSVRVLEGAVELAVTAVSSSTSHNNTGKLEASLKADLARLKILAMNASEHRFNEALQAAVMRLVRLTRKLLR